jgi:hypothetical protein
MFEIVTRKKAKLRAALTGVGAISTWTPTTTNITGRGLLVGSGATATWVPTSGTFTGRASLVGTGAIAAWSVASGNLTGDMQADDYNVTTWF